KKSPVRFNRYENRYFNLPDWSTMAAPITEPQPGANIGTRLGSGLVGADCDTEEAAQKFLTVFPGSPVVKRGQKGFTAFYRADFDVPSENWYDENGNKVIEILSAGRQTVIPPSIHPDTKTPYEWVNGHSLYDTPLSGLSPWPTDYRERILSLGY